MLKPLVLFKISMQISLQTERVFWIDVDPAYISTFFFRVLLIPGVLGYRKKTISQM